MPLPVWLLLIIVGFLLLLAARYLVTDAFIVRLLMFFGYACIVVGILLVGYALFVLATGSGGARLTSLTLTYQVSQERPGGVPENPMDANAIALIGVPVVALTQMSKWAKLPDNFGPIAVLVFAALGVSVWVMSYGGYRQADMFNYFVAWITVAVAAAGVFGFTRASAGAVTRAMPPPEGGAGSSKTE